MNPKEELLQTIEQTPESLLAEVLDFLLFLRERYEEQEDLADIRAARTEIEQEGSTPWTVVKQELGLQ
jgi:hypothetical protein